MRGRWFSAIFSSFLLSALYTPPINYTLHAHATAGAEQGDTERNVSLVVLPTGAGKSGVAVYACAAEKVLVITPSAAISKQLLTQFRRGETGIRRTAVLF